VNRSAPDPVTEVLDFLPCRTPNRWFEQAAQHIPTLLIDHANCEKKAVGTALSLMYRYVDRPALLQRLSRLAREELRHFEQVHQIMQSRKIDYTHISSSRYAGELRKLVAHNEPQRLIDTLLTGAIVEARSCERFHGLVEVLPSDLGEFYAKLLDSEARHFKSYLKLARDCADADVVAGLDGRLEVMLEVEARLVCAPDGAFRFHSGPIEESAPAAR
jgi:tRNA-(ms[2]io[6]A)-hydroxylase